MRNLFILIGTLLCIHAFSATITPSGVLTSGNCKHGYTVQLSTTGLTGTVTFSLTAGSLPPGVALSTAGLIQGFITTTADAAYTFTLSARGTGTVVATSTNTINVTAINNRTIGNIYSDWTAPTYPTNSQVFDDFNTLLNGGGGSSSSIGAGNGLTTYTVAGVQTLSVTSPITTPITLCQTVAGKHLISQSCDSIEFFTTTGFNLLKMGKNSGWKFYGGLGSSFLQMDKIGQFSVNSGRQFYSSTNDYFVTANNGAFIQGDNFRNPVALTLNPAIASDGRAYLNGSGGVVLSDTLDTSLGGGSTFTRNSAKRSNSPTINDSSKEMSTTEYVKQNIAQYIAAIGYKEYVAIVTQTGTSAPVPTVLVNTLGVTPVWARVSAGNYTFTQTGFFDTLKTVCTFQSYVNTSTGGENILINPYKPSQPNAIQVLCSNNVGVYRDNGTFMMILRKYP